MYKKIVIKNIKDNRPILHAVLVALSFELILKPTTASHFTPYASRNQKRSDRIEQRPPVPIPMNACR